MPVPEQIKAFPLTMPVPLNAVFSPSKEAVPSAKEMAVPVYVPACALAISAHASHFRTVQEHCCPCLLSATYIHQMSSVGTMSVPAACFIMLHQNLSEASNAFFNI